MLLFVQAQVQFLSFSYLPSFPIPLTVIWFALCTVWGNYSQKECKRTEVMCTCDSFRFCHQIGLSLRLLDALVLIRRHNKCVGACACSCSMDQDMGMNRLCLPVSVSGRWSWGLVCHGQQPSQWKHTRLAPPIAGGKLFSAHRWLD